MRQRESMRWQCIPERQNCGNMNFNAYRSLFLNQQYAKGNSEVTIKHYNQSFRKMSRFLCRNCTDAAKYKVMARDEQEQTGGSVAVAAFEKKGIEGEYRKYLEDVEHCAPKTVETYFRDWRVILYSLMDMGLIQKHQIIVREVETDVREVYTDEELAKLLEKPAADAGFVEWHNWAVINWVLATGNRISTICNILISDVDFSDDMIFITKQKNRRKSSIPLEYRLRKVLLEYMNMWLVDDNCFLPLLLIAVAQ